MRISIPVVPSAYLERLPPIAEKVGLGALRSIIDLSQNLEVHYWTVDPDSGGRFLVKVFVALTGTSPMMERYLLGLEYQEDEDTYPSIEYEIDLDEEDPETPPGTFIEHDTDSSEDPSTQAGEVSLLSPSARMDAQKFFDDMEHNGALLAAFLDEAVIHCPASCN